eukprot:15447668-Alexandrium_andersonii.AAC.1
MEFLQRSGTCIPASFLGSPGAGFSFVGVGGDQAAIDHWIVRQSDRGAVISVWVDPELDDSA